MNHHLCYSVWGNCFYKKYISVYEMPVNQTDIRYVTNFSPIDTTIGVATL